MANRQRRRLPRYIWAWSAVVLVAWTAGAAYLIRWDPIHLHIELVVQGLLLFSATVAGCLVIIWTSDRQVRAAHAATRDGLARILPDRVASSVASNLRYLPMPRERVLHTTTYIPDPDMTPQRLATIRDMTADNTKDIQDYR